MCIDAYGRSAGRDISGNRTCAGREIVFGVFGIDSTFDCTAGVSDVTLAESELFAGGDAELPFNEVVSGDHFGDGVLDLDTSIDFDEIKVLVFVEEELDRSCIGIVCLFDDSQCSLAKLVSVASIEEGTGRLFYHFLVSPLYGAVSFVKMQGVSVLIGEDLDLDVPRFEDEFFEIDTGIAEGGLGFSLRCGKCLPQADIVVDGAHSPAAAASRGLYDDGIAELACEFEGFGLIGHGSCGARYDRDVSLLGQPASLDFVTKKPHSFDGRADEFYSAVITDLCKLDILRQEAVAGVYGVDVGDFGGADNSGYVKVAFCRCGRADADSLVGEFEIGAAGISLGIYGDCGDVQFVAGANDTQGNFAAVSYKYS